jgi:tetratricopeptide (TPR) repeat protein
VARKKRHQQPSAAQTLDQIESSGDKLVQWVLDNQVLILGTGIAILLVAGVWGFSRELGAGSVDESSSKLAQTHDQFLSAMGSSPNSLEVTEPANPQTARDVRTEYVERFRGVAIDFPGTVAGALALLEAGKLFEELGNDTAAIESYQAGLEEIDPANAASGFLHARIGAVHEDTGRWSEAADAYESAAGVAQYELKSEALADAARSLIHAGERERALGVYAQLQSDAPTYRVSPYLEAQIDELRSQSPSN